MQSADGVQVNIEKIASLFPDCVTETIVGYDADDKPILRHKVDFEKLQQNLSSEIMQRFDLVEMKVRTSIIQKTCI